MLTVVCSHGVNAHADAITSSDVESIAPCSYETMEVAEDRPCMAPNAPEIDAYAELSMYRRHKPDRSVTTPTAQQ